MSRTTQKRIALGAALICAVILVGNVVFLVTDFVFSRQRTPAEKARLEALEQAATEDAANVEALEAERERQTAAAHRRVARQDLQATLLIGSSVLFLIFAKWLISLRGQIAPAFEAIHEARRDLLRVDNRSHRRKRSARRAESGGRPCEVAGRDGDPAVDLSFVEAVVEREGRRKEAAIPIIQAIQSHYRYLPDEALRRVCELTEISPAQIAGVATFYAQFRRSPVGQHVVKVCLGTACHVSRALEIVEEIRRHLEIAPDADTDPTRMFTVDKVACLGCCSLAPVIMIDSETAGNLTPASACEKIDEFRREGGHASD